MADEPLIVRENKLNDLEKLLEVSKALLMEKDLTSLLDLIARKTREVMRAERVSLFILDQDSNEIWTHIAQNLEVKEIRLPVGKGIAGFVAKTGQTVNIPDAYADPRFDPNSDMRTGYKTRSILCAPLKGHSGMVIGVIQVLNKDGGPFTKYDEELMQAFGGQASVAVENATLLNEIELSFQSMLKTMAAALDARDPVAAGHSERVARYATEIARKMGLSEQEIKAIDYAAHLHDVGKIGVPDDVLLKPGKLTPEEYEIMKRHAVKTRDILDQVRFAREFKAIPEIASAHHERIDGLGYPNGLKGAQVSRSARILAVADVFDALVSYDRPYKRAMTIDEAIEVLRKGSGKAFDADVVDAFIEKKLYLRDKKESISIGPDIDMEYTLVTKEELSSRKMLEETRFLNVGGDGLMFRSGKFIPPGTFVDVSVRTAGETHQMLARVVRTTRIEGQDKYEIGLKFINLPHALRARLSKHLIELMD